MGQPESAVISHRPGHDDDSKKAMNPKGERPVRTPDDLPSRTADPSYPDCPLGFGSQYGYTVNGCRCRACTASSAAAQRRLAARRVAAGGRPLTATPEEVERARQQIVLLTSLGWPQKVIAKAGRISDRPVTTIASGKVTRPRLETVEAIGRAYEKLTSSDPQAEKSRTAGVGAAYMPPPAHGTLARYRRGCKCRPCREAEQQRSKVGRVA